MSQGEPTNDWEAYYDRFDYFSRDGIRAGCHPRLLLQPEAAEKAVVLVHGLSDSPYFMAAIGNYFFETLKYDVYIPLLHFHGLKEPRGMEGVDLNQWKANVRYSVEEAAKRSDEISIGGLSTGGALSFYETVTNPAVNGALYLFSAGLDLAGGRIGDLKERLLRKRFLVDLFDSDKPLVADHPYKYARVDKDGAAELSKLIRENDELIARHSRRQPFRHKTFAAHSEADTSAGIEGIEELHCVSDANQFTFYRIAKEEDVGHANLVLDRDIPNGEVANPLFDDMMAAIKIFAEQD